jgi:hypothetical protein
VQDCTPPRSPRADAGAKVIGSHHRSYRCSVPKSLKHRTYYFVVKHAGGTKYLASTSALRKIAIK